MSYLLCIDSSVTDASVAIAKDGELLHLLTNGNQREHAGFLQPAIKESIRATGIHISQLAAVCVTIGPGSYTGLRIGLASAKGICYALGIPLITIHTTLLMAEAAMKQKDSVGICADDLLCPMIDARRMEVFTAVYNTRLECLQPPHPLILSATAFAGLLEKHRIFFFGNGSVKWQAVCAHQNANFISLQWNASDMMMLADKMYATANFADLGYAAPLYGKNFNEVAN